MRNLAIAAVAIATVATSGCAITRPASVAGCCFTDAKADNPNSVTAHVGASKSGSATATSYLGWIGLGDSSIATAAKAGGITKINFVDYKVTNILGIIGTYTTVVYGE